MMGRLLAYSRLAVFVLGTLFFAVVLTLVAVLRPNSLFATVRVKQIWMRFAIWVIGLRIEYQGVFPKEKVLFLPNHRSYLDVVLIPVRALCTLVGKQEVRKWPVIGYGAEKARIIFVDRKDPLSRQRTRITLRSRLDEGLNAVVFPEGTTFREGLGPYKAGMFQIAAEGGIPIVPVAIEYQDLDDAWVGDETFLPHFLRVAGRLRTPVKVRLGTPITGTDSKALMERTYSWTLQACAELRQEWDGK